MSNESLFFFFFQLYMNVITKLLKSFTTHCTFYSLRLLCNQKGRAIAAFQSAFARPIKFFFVRAVWPAAFIRSLTNPLATRPVRRASLAIGSAAFPTALRDGRATLFNQEIRLPKKPLPYWTPGNSPHFGSFCLVARSVLASIV